jgi:hypothetical protein
VRVTPRLPLACLAVAGLVAVATAAAATPGGAAAPSAARHGGVIHPLQQSANTSTSGNWFGYNVSGVKRRALFGQIGGTWRVPTVTQHTAGQAEHSSAWIGIGGGCVTAGCLVTDNTLIQTGTAHSVDANGVAQYTAWYELIPAPSITTPLAVKPGDLIRANIDQVVRGVWKITLTNLTTGRGWSTTLPYSSTGLTGEWIAETPLTFGTGGAGLASLPNLTPVHFDNATLNHKNPRLNANDRVLLAASNGSIIGTPSNPQSDGNGFAACTWTTSCAVPANY